MTLGAVIVVALVLLVVGVGIVRLTTASMLDDATAAAEVQARNLAIVVEAGRLGSVLDVDAAGSTILQVASSDGEVLAASRQLAGMPPLDDSMPLSGHTITRTVRIVGPAETIDYQVVAIASESPEGPVAVFAGVSLTGTKPVLDTLTRLLLVGLGAVLVIVALVSWLVVGRALRPVEEIRSEVSRLTEQDLFRRVPVPNRRDELGRLAMTMNGMLERLEAAAARQRTFIADASHELRSPIASLRTQLEVTVAHPAGQDASEVAAEALKDVQALEALSVDLLRLTRLDAGVAAEPESFDLSWLLDDVLKPRYADRVPIEVDAPSEVPCFAAPREVRQVLTNLLDNAVRHATSRVAITLTRGSTPQEPVMLTVSDDGPGIPDADRERIFDRFVRLDAPRSREEGGTGLGLAIAKQSARTQGGDVLALATEQGASFRVTLPAAD